MEDHGGGDAGWGNSWLVHQSSLAVLPAETSGASTRNGRRSDTFAYQYLQCLNRPLTCRKILRHGTSGFTSHPKEGVLRIFIALKNLSPRPGLNPRPLGPVATTLTITPPRRLRFPNCPPPLGGRCWSSGWHELFVWGIYLLWTKYRPR
jgi:hypothetical protein